MESSQRGACFGRPHGSVAATFQATTRTGQLEISAASA